MKRSWRMPIGLAITAALVIAVLPMLLKGPLERGLQRLIASRASAALAAPVKIAGLHISLFPASVRLDEVSLSPGDGDGARTEGRVESIEVTGNPLALLGSRHALAIEVLGPRLSIHPPARPPSEEAAATPGGDRDFLALAAQGVGGLPAAWELRVRDGEVDLDWSGAPMVRLAGVSLEASPGRLPVAVMNGRAGFTDGSIRSPAFDWGGLEGDGAFELAVTGLRFDAVSIRGDGLTVAADGLVRGGPPVEVEGSVALEADATSLARLLPTGADPAGRLTGRVEGRWSRSSLEGRGMVTLDAARVWGLQVDALQAALRIDDTVHLESIRMRLLGGEGSGSVEVTRPSPGVVGVRSKLRLAGIDLERALAFAGWSGPRMRGTLRYEGEHSIDTSGLASLRGSGRAEASGRYLAPSGTDLPVRVHSRIETRGAATLLEGGTIEAGTVSGRFSGSVSPGEGLRLRLSGATGNLSEILPLFAAPSRPRSGARPGATGGDPASLRSARLLVPIPLIIGAGDPPSQSALERILQALGGRWEWDGDLQYSVAGGLSFTGTLAGSGLTHAGRPLGRLRARVAYRAETLTITEAILEHEGGGEVRLAGQVAFTAPGRMAIDATASGFPAAALVALAGSELPVEGLLGARIHLGGRPDAPQGRVEIEGGPVTVAGFEFERLVGDIDLSPRDLVARELVLSRGPASITVSGSLPYTTASPDAPEAAAGGLSIRARGLDLSAWLSTLSGMPLAATLEGEGDIGGSLESPAGTLAIRLTDVQAWGKSIGAVSIDAALAGSAMTLTGSAPLRDMAFEGRVGLGEDHRLDLRAIFTDSEIRGAEIMEEALEGAGLVLSGGLAVGGRYDSLRDISAQMLLETLRITLPGARIDNDGVVEAVLEGGRLRLEPVVMIGSGTRVDVRGEVFAGPGGRIDATARGTFDLAFLRAFAGPLQATGQGEVEVSIGGTHDAPVFEGDLRIVANKARYAGLPFPVDDLDGRLVFDGSGLHIETLTFRAGGGEVTGSGGFQLGGPDPADGPLGIHAARLRFVGKGVNAQFPEGFRSLSDADLRFVIDQGVASLSGTIDLIRGVYYRDFEVESSIVRGEAPGLFGTEGPSGPLADLRLDLAIRADGDLWLRNDFGSMEGKTDLRITGSAAQPSVAGRVTIMEGGSIRFNSVRYRVVSGTLDFTDPVTINPVFDLSAETTVGDYQVNLKVDGTADNFSFELTSTPPLPQSDIVALLLTGRPGGSLGPEGGALAEEAATAYLTGRLSEELSGRLSDMAGLDVIAIDPLQVNGQGDPATRVTLGKQITPDLFVSYSDEIGSNAGSIYQLDYAIRRRLRLTTVRDVDGSLGGDLKYIWRQAPPSLPGLESTAAAVDQPILGAIRLEGNLRYDEPKIRRLLRLKTGRPRRRAAVNEAGERLRTFYHDHGFLMARVDIDESAAGEGVVELLVQVEAGAKVTIEIEGARGREGLRQKVAPYWEQGLFPEDIVETARGKIERIFRDRGYLAAEVQSEVLRNDTRHLRVRFTVRRGPRVQADSVGVAGAAQLSEKEILEVVRTSPDTLFSRGIVRQGRLVKDADAIRDLYLSRGFARVAVAEPEVAVDDSTSRASVVFHIDEGPRVTIRQVRFEGADSVPQEAVVRWTALPEGGPYTRESAEAAALRLRRAYDGAGFPDVRVTFHLEPVVIDPVASQADLVFLVAEGARQRVGRVEIQGNLITREDVIRKSLAVTPGRSLSRADMLASQRRIYRLGILNSVQIEPLPEAPPAADAGESAVIPGDVSAAGSIDDAGMAAPGGAGTPSPPFERRQVRVTVREAGPLSQVYGVGFDSEEKARGQYEIANRNILGSGRYLGLQTRASRLEQRGSVLYREGGIFGGRFDALASAFWRDEVRPAFDVRSIGSSIQLSRQVTGATRLRYRYSLEDVDLSDASADFDEGTTLRLSSLSASAVHDTRDSPFNPLKGHYFGAEVQLFARALGSEADFTKAYGQFYFFREVLPNTVWAQAVRLGAANPFGRSQEDPTSTGDSFSGVPGSERFFAGGDTTLRGFRRDEVGETDERGEPVGGEGLFILNEELRFPIFRKLQGVVFYDVGNVFRTLDDYSLGDLRHVAGAGIRVGTPIGPFRLEYGAILDRRDDEPRGEFFFSIGQAF